MTWHYDIRVRCPLSGQLESTEDIGLTFERALHNLDGLREWMSRREYVIVSCDRPGSDRVHDVDLAYHVHVAMHEGQHDAEWLGYIGAPQDSWIEQDTASPRS